MRDLSIPVLFINLDQSSDRLTFMRRQAERLGLDLERIAAVDALNVPDDLAGYFAHIQTGRLPIIDDGAIGCYASHLKALTRFEQTDAPAALVLEDDALLPDNIAQVLNELIAKLPTGWGFVHLSHAPTHAFKPIAALPHGGRVVRYSRMPPNAAGYLISRAGAAKLLDKSIQRFWAIDTDIRRPWVFGHDAYGVIPPPIEQLAMPTTIPRLRRSARRGLPHPTRFSWVNMPLRSPASLLFNLRQLGLIWWVRCAVVNAVKRVSRLADGNAGVLAWRQGELGPGAIAAISRILHSAALMAHARVADFAQPLVRRHSQSRPAGPSPIGPMMAGSFSEIPAYKALLKHRGLAKSFGLADPFYKCHNARLGAHIWIGDRCYTNFASYDYLGLNQHPSVIEAATAAIARHGTSVSASRIVAGERPFHRDLETALADLYGAEGAITFVSGHATNVSTIATLLSTDDLVLHDELVHNSVLIGAKLSQATARSFRHNDLIALEKLLEQNRMLHQHALIAVEGLYSMDGDVPNLPRLIELKDRYGAWLMVDEAHALGVLGSRGHGSAEHFGVEAACVDIWMGTLSKALASCGGYIAGKKELVDLLRFQAPGLVYSVGLSPPLAAAASAALRLLKNEPERVVRLQSNGRLFLAEATAAGLNTGTSQGHAIVSVIVGDLVTAGRLTERLLARGVNVLPIIFPAVPIKAARLRFFITSQHTPAQIRDAVRLLREELDGLPQVRKAA